MQIAFEEFECRGFSVNVAALSGMFPQAGQNYFVLRVGQEKCKQLLLVTANVSRGQDILGLTRSRRLMMKGTRVSGCQKLWA
jgi:hypothetical protein